MAILDPHDYGLSDEERELAAMVRAFADERSRRRPTKPTAPRPCRWTSSPRWGRWGCSDPFPEDVGGQGGDGVALGLAIEALARVDQSIAITLEAAVSLGAMPVFRFGTDAQRAHFFPTCSPGARSPASVSPNPKRDRMPARPAPPLVSRRRVGHRWSQAVHHELRHGHHALRHRHGGDRRQRRAQEISTIIVPSGTPGFTVGPAYDKVGWHASDTHPLSFSGARVPAENLLGERGRGFANFLSILDEGRIAIAALATGAAEGCLEAALDYAGSRIVFAEPLGSRQSIQFLLARMQQRVHCRAWRGCTPRACATPGGRSRPPPRWPSSRRARRRWTTRGMRRRSSAATAS
jgi:alkylation response protein AidB-like acyl-CoA dehydrogenase